MERTLSIVKPDGVRAGHIGNVIQTFEANGLKVVAQRMLHMTKEQAEGFYAVHKERPFFASLTDFMSSGPVVVMVLEGEEAISRVRKLMGATDPKQAEPDTIRAKFATNIEQNVVHGSDATKTAKAEIGYFFSGLEIKEPCVP